MRFECHLFCQRKLLLLWCEGIHLKHYQTRNHSQNRMVELQFYFRKINEAFIQIYGSNCFHENSQLEIDIYLPMLF